jgi:hypothetical protein
MSDAEPDAPDGPTAAPAESARPPANDAHSEAKDTPMLDVHPPHEAVHTWKDFCIHIIAIVIGLLIAVGLEQTVSTSTTAFRLPRPAKRCAASTI